jgi:hypothetical protein
MNAQKRQDYALLLVEYRRVLQLVIDLLWTTRYYNEIEVIDKKSGEIGTKTISFDIQNDCIEIPSFYPSVDHDEFHIIDTWLSARMMKCVHTQALGIVRGVLKKSFKKKMVLNRLYEKLRLESDSDKQLHIENEINRLEQKYHEMFPSKPVVNDKIGLELSPQCCKFYETNEDGVCFSFDYFIEIRPIHAKGIKDKPHDIMVPVKRTRNDRRIEQKGFHRINSILLSNESIDIRWEMEPPGLRTEGEIIGIDQGVRSVITTSNGFSESPDIHGHTYASIMKELAGKKKGSKAFQRTKTHLMNHMRRVINQLNIGGTGIKEVRLEDIFKLVPKSRYLSHFNYASIEDKIQSDCEIYGVHFVLQSPTYRSQRCNSCGYVHKSNRRNGGLLFECKGCGHVDDADSNAAKNHAVDLPSIGVDMRRLQLNRVGFYWTPSGLVGINGKDLAVPSK